MKLDFSKLQIKGVNKKPFEKELMPDGSFQGPSQVLGDKLFIGMKDIKMSQVAEDIYNDKPVDLTLEQVESLKNWLNLDASQNGLAPFFSRQVLQFISDAK